MYVMRFSEVEKCFSGTGCGDVGTSALTCSYRLLWVETKSKYN